MTRAAATAQVGLILLIAFVVALAVAWSPVGAANPNAKWFVCKYTTTPGGEEVLQSGQNPISVSESAIPISPVVVGATFSDAQGRSLVIEEDIGQAEPAAECPEHPPSPTPSPSPSLSASPSATPSLSPSPSPSPSASPTPSPTPSPPVVTAFSVEVCPATGEPVATGRSLIRFEHPLLVLLLLNVRIDGDLVQLRDVPSASVAGLIAGSAAEVEVSVGVHDWSISNPADTEVLASGTVNCPECNPAAPTPPPATAPPEIPDTALGR